MTTTVESLPVGETDSDLARVRVRTEDAAGAYRSYDISLSTNTVDGAHVMAGRRVDGDAPDEPAGGGPSERAYEVAAERFNEAGHEVFGR